MNRNRNKRPPKGGDAGGFQRTRGEASPMQTCRICGRQAPYGFSFLDFGAPVWEYYCTNHRDVGEDRIRRS